MALWPAAVSIQKQLSSERIDALENMHASLAVSGLKWAAKLEGAYIPKHAIRRFDPHDLARATINEGKFYLGHQGSDWVIQRHILREQGVIIAGPDPKVLIDPVTADEIQRAVEIILNEWWFPMLDNPVRLQHSDYQAYAILSMCRVLHTLKTGELGSKLEAAYWAQEALDQHWADLIEQALTWRGGEVLNKFDQSIAFIRYTLEHAMIFHKLEQQS